MILNYFNNVNEGSSFLSPAHGCGGARAIINESAARKNFRRQCEGGSAGGFKGGMPSRPSRSETPPPCSFRAEPSKILFSLIEKVGRAQNKKCKEYFARRRASASGGGTGRQFRPKKVRAFSNKGRKECAVSSAGRAVAS